MSLTGAEINILTMTMNMSIIMNMNIYITRENEEWLRKQPSMSGVINRLLGEARSNSSQSAGSSLTDKDMLSNIKKAFGGGSAVGDILNSNPKLQVTKIEDWKTVQDPSPVEQDILDSLPRDLPVTTANKLKTNGKCRKCGAPLTSFGKCLQKGH